MRSSNKTHVISVEVNVRDLALLHRVFKDANEGLSFREISTLGGLARFSLTKMADMLESSDKGIRLETIGQALQYLEDEGLTNLTRPLKRNISNLVQAEVLSRSTDGKADTSGFSERDLDILEKAKKMLNEQG